MTKTIDVIRVVVRMTSFSTASASWPRKAASSIAPTAPTAADSVGVAIPPKIEPSTAAMSRAGGAKTFAI